MQEGFFPEAKGRVKFQETPTSYFYRAGNFIYKIRREISGSGGPALREAFAHDAHRAGLRWGPGVYHGVLPIVRRAEGFALAGEGQAIAYALKMTHLSGGHWLDRLIAQKKLTPTAVGRVARFLAEGHALEPKKELSPEIARADHLRLYSEEMFYQVKKYLGITVAAPLLDVVSRPVLKFIDEFRKVLQRRQKRGLIVECHGAFMPEHIYLLGKEVVAISPLYGAPNFRVQDSANDLATLLNEMELAGAGESGELFVKRYAFHSKDRDIGKVLPLFLTLRAMQAGLSRSEELSEPGLSPAEQKAAAERAQRYFNLAARLAREKFGQPGS